MDQFLVLHHNIAKNDRNFQLMLVPGSPYEDIFAVLDEFKEKFVAMQAEFKAKEEQAKAQAEQPAQEVEAEILS